MDEDLTPIPDAIVIDPKDETTNKPGEILEQLSEAEKRRKTVEFYKQSYMKRHNIVGVDIEKEFDLIQKKASKLSRAQREAVIGAIQIFPMIEQVSNQKEIEDIPVGDPLTAAEVDTAIADSSKEADKSAE